MFKVTHQSLNTNFQNIQGDRMYSGGTSSRFGQSKNEIKSNYKRKIGKFNKYTTKNKDYLINNPILISKTNYFNSRIRLNISGKIFEIPESILSKYPMTLLGCYEDRIKFYDYLRDEFFFDRNREAFEGNSFF
ncbi:unnamed protein product [Brachionus calyciflorus]|uniref:Potassium channel tetramerisation-type BTB domain-containing protein n=1 Tax=Brachionus calyciflorus TaxID=104777 RepID=A0A813ZTQ7_9BILA|nr:unnamed protein product [Brachionus calyciflorus]